LAESEPGPSTAEQSDGSASTEALFSFLSLFPDAALVVDGEGHIVSVNEQAESLFGYEPGSLTGSPVETLIPERARERHRQHRSAFATAPARRPMGNKLELSGRRRDGTEFPVDISLAPISASGRDLVVAAVRDVTEQRAATAAQAELAAIVRSSLDAVISTTLAGLVTSWNPAAEELLGYQPEEIVGRHVSVLVPETARPLLDELIARAVDDPKRGATDMRWRRKDGAEVDVAVSVSPLRDRVGVLLGFSSVVRDISERKLAEQELQRLFAEEERLERQQSATAEIRLALLSGTRLDEVLTIICQRVAELVDAAVAVLSLRRGSRLEVVAAAGPAAPMVDDVLSGGSFSAQVLESARPGQVARRSLGSDVVVPDGVPDGPMLGVPVLAGGAADVVLILVREEGRPEFSPADVVAAEGLASQAALALQLERARADREEVMLAGDRERIARDLHDLVIQQLFATGMTLQSTLAFIERPTAKERVSGAIEALDDTIREVRNTIYGLSRPAHAEHQLRALVIELAERAGEQLGFEPSVHFDGPVDSAVPDDVVPHVLAVVREALSNVARHARATEARVEVVVDDGDLCVAVEDDGVGIGDASRRSGLANLEERAKLLGGSFRRSVPRGGGTRLEWRVALRR